MPRYVKFPGSGPSDVPEPPPPPSATTGHRAKKSDSSILDELLGNDNWLSSTGLLRGCALAGLLVLAFGLGWWSKPDEGAPAVTAARTPGAPSPPTVHTSAAAPSPAVDPGLAAAPPASFPAARETAAAMTAPDDPPMTWVEIREIQGRLRGFGYEVGPLDGVVGRQTTAAIRQFQAALALPATGTPDRDLLQRLRAKAGTGQ